MTGKSPFRSYKTFNRSRNLLRTMFVYGIYTRSELAELFSLSNSMIEKDIYWLNRLIGKNISTTDKKGNEYCYNMDYQYYEHIENYLVEAYLAKSTTKHRLPLFFFMLHELSTSDKPLTEKELFEPIGATYYPDEPFDMKPRKRMLNDLISWGIVSKKKYSRNFVYSLEKDFFKDFSCTELNDIYNAVVFFSNTSFPSVPGRYLKDTLSNYLRYRNHPLNSNEKHYIYRYRNFHPVLDEEIIWQLLPNIKNKTRVNIEYQSINWDSPQDLLVTPLKLIHNVRYGRWYLIGSEDNVTLKIYRIDNISGVTATNEAVDTSELENLYKDRFDFSWVITPKYSTATTKIIDMVFTVDSSNYFHYLLAKVEREKKWGNITNIDIENNSFHLSIEVNDIKEIKPWIRGFGFHVEVLPSTEHNLREELQNEWKEMLALYGAL